MKKEEIEFTEFIKLAFKSNRRPSKPILLFLDGKWKKVDLTTKKGNDIYRKWLESKGVKL